MSNCVVHRSVLQQGWTSAADFPETWDRLLTQVEDLREYNKGLQAQIKNQQLGATVGWEKLQGFDDQQLRNWVKVGARMARKNHPNPVNNATRHVEGSRLQLAAP